MSKEKFEEIKERYMEREYDYALKSMDIDYLIQQSEEKIQLEKRVEELEKNLDHGAKVAVKTAEKLHYVKEENQRYKQALEEIAYKQYNVEPKRVVVKLRSTAIQALQGGNNNE
ncbi:hypothetical protein [Ornithinibacillus xuwenensis]|uniref:Phage protein n=1 Tax=Ornithinibacillus xuwenensis TaxID=3144668 RepID=A0ABU9XCH3_9BACI